jgi:hypothetical protein
MRKRGKKTLMESATDLAESVLPAIESAVETAVETAKDTVDKAAPILAEGKEIAREKAKEGKQVAQEKAHRGRRRAAAKLAALKEAEASEKVAAFKAAEPNPEKSGRLKKLVLLSGLVALGGVIFKRLRGAPSKSNWQSSYVPQPAPQQAPTHKAPADTPVPEAAAPEPTHVPDDEAAASPDEALADRAAEPHPDTTPDDPAEVVELRAVEDAVPLEDTGASEAPAASQGGARKKS